MEPSADGAIRRDAAQQNDFPARVPARIHTESNGVPEQRTLFSRWTRALKRFSRDCSVIAALSVLSVYFYFLMEWIFFASKPSFMSSLAVSEKFSALVIPPGLFCIAFLCATAAREWCDRIRYRRQCLFPHGTNPASAAPGGQSVHPGR
jgi:hypothetical protein